MVETTFDLMVRQLGETWVGAAGCRGPLRDQLAAGDLHALAEHALAALPKEVLVACGGCGGEPVVAGFREDGFTELADDVADFFGLDQDQEDRSLWAKLEAIPLVIKRPPPS